MVVRSALRGAATRELVQPSTLWRSPWPLAAALVCAVAGAADAAPEKAAVFEFQLANLGQLPPTDADKKRLPHLSDMLRDLLAKSGKYEIVPIDPVRAKAQSEDLRACGGCADDYAKQLGAQVAVTGQIQKVSDLILNINVYIKEVGGTKPEQAYSVDIRGDNDLSFDHGIKYIVKHNILKE